VNHIGQRPLCRWRLANFKSVAEADVELAPLTVLVGANSTGKSSLIQSILLVAQSAAPGEPDLSLNGPLVELGEFADLRRQGARSRSRISIGCELWVDGLLGYAGGGPASGAVRWRADLSDPGRDRDPGRAVVHRVELEVPSSQGSTLLYRAKRAASRGDGPSPPPGEAGQPGAVELPGRVKLPRRVDGRAVFATDAAVLRAGVPVAIVAAGERRSPDPAGAVDPDPAGIGPPLPDTARRRLEAGGRGLADTLASRVLHLGPLRQEPRLLYLNTPSAVPGFVGSKGERAFAVLHRYGQLMIECPCADGRTRRTTLRDGVNLWLAELGVGLSVTTVHRPRLGLEPELRMEGLARGLSVSAVGVGVSQVLPVLVMGLAAEPGSVLLLEQPELHLHPAVQQRLGDFLLACVRAGRQVVVETHSDHLLTRIRRRVAEDDSDQLAAAVTVVFTERRDGATRFRRLATNRYGGLDEWPEGFFDDAAREAQHVVLAGLRKREADDE
jgi:predicted ATPase